MGHGRIACAFAAILFAALGAVDLLGRASPAPGAVWVLARGSPGALLARLPADGSLRILQTWAAGRVVLLHAPALARAQLPEGAAWFTLRASPAMFLLPACG